MADNEIRNPAKAYFKWKMPVIAKSEDDWNFWNTEDKYNRTLFIGYNDTTTPHVASLFMIVDGKAMQAVGDDVIARIAGLETNTAQALADIQALIDRVNAQQLEISNLQQECQRILEDAESAVRAAQIWSEGTDEQVAKRGGEHSAKGWAQKANDIVAAGLPSDATFDHITVTGSSKFGQDPDRANQPGLEIEGTGEIQAYRTVNMMNGATVSYDETVEMPWSDSSNKVPNTAWVQQAVQHGTIDPNTELTIKALTLTNGILKQDHTKTQDDGTYKNPKMHFESDAEKFWVKCEAMPDFPRSIELLMMPQYSDARQEHFTVTAKESTTTGAFDIGATSFSISIGNGACSIGGSTAHSKKDISITTRQGNLFIPSVAVSENSRKLAYAATTKYVHDAIKADSAEITADFQPKLTAGAGIEISADNVISATGGSGAVTSVNGKTGEVVLAAADVGAAPADALASYVTTDALNTELASKQDKLTAESDLTINNFTAASVSSSGTIKAANADNSKYAQVGGTGLIYSSTGSTNYMHDITDHGLRLRKIADNGSQQTALIEAVSGDNAYLQTTGGFILQKSSWDTLDTRSPTTYMTMLGDEIQLFKATVCRASMPSATDSSTTVPTTSWVQGAVAAKTANLQPKLTAGANITISEDNVISATGGTGGGAVSSVNGKTGEVVLNASDVGAITGAEADTKITTALEPYAKSADVTADITAAVEPLATTEALNTGLAGKQDKLTAESDLSVNSLTSAKGLTSETGTVSAKKIQTVADTTYNADGSFTRVCLHDMVTKSGGLGYVTLNGDEIRINGKNSGKALTYLSSTGIYDTTAKPAADASNTRVGTTAWVQSAITAKTANLQPKLTAGTGIAISADNVISATVSSAVDSVNGKTGAVVLTGEDVNVDTTSGAATVKAAIAAKQDAITAGTDLDVHSLKAHFTATTPEGENQQYTMDVTGNGFELKDSINNISCAKLTPLYLDVPSLTILGAPGVTTLLTCYGPAKIANISSIGDQWTTGAFNWDINTTTDYNKFEVYNLYYTTDTETGSEVPNRSVLFSIGGSPDNHSTWIDFTANYLSFKGDANFGEYGMSNLMSFNGPSTFNNEATFTQNVTLGHGETTVEGEGGTPTTTPASLVSVEGDIVANGNATFNKGLSASGTVHINNATFWREVGGGVIPAASYSYSTGMFNISYLTSIDDGNGANRVNIVSDSREASYGAVFNLPVTVSDASFKRTSTLAADDNSEEVPTTAWVKTAIASSGGSVPDDITCKTLGVTDTSTVHILNVGDGKEGQKFNCDANASFGYDVNLGWLSGRFKCMRDEYNWLFDFNRNANAEHRLRFNEPVTILYPMPAATDSSNKVPTTAWVQGAITAKAATKPTLTHVTKSRTFFITTKVEQCDGGKLCTIYWRSTVVNKDAHYYIDVPADFSDATITSTVFTSNDSITPAVWVATATLTNGKIKMDVSSTNTQSSGSASAIIVLYKA